MYLLQAGPREPLDIATRCVALSFSARLVPCHYSGECMRCAINGRFTLRKHRVLSCKGAANDMRVDLHVAGVRRCRLTWFVTRRTTSQLGTVPADD